MPHATGLKAQGGDGAKGVVVCGVEEGARDFSMWGMGSVYATKIQIKEVYFFLTLPQFPLPHQRSRAMHAPMPMRPGVFLAHPWEVRPGWALNRA